MIVFFTTNISEGKASLSGDEHSHCTRVLRKKVGDLLVLVDGEGNRYSAKIAEINKHDCQLDVLSKESKVLPSRKIAIAIAPTKNISRFEWFLEKATEMGISDIYPLLMARSERKRLKEERCAKIVMSAFKQSLRWYKPKLHEFKSVKEFMESDINNYSHKYVASFQKGQDHLQNIDTAAGSSLVIIGPEGDFTTEELDLCNHHGFKQVNISENRLRTETAGIVALQYIL